MRQQGHCQRLRDVINKNVTQEDLLAAENILDANEPTEPETPVSPDGQPVPDDTDNETADDNQTVTDEISLRPIGKSAVDEYGGYWDYDLSNATFDAINDLREGMELTGIVGNITNFGAFVDIGIKENGLVHLSQLADRFISDPNEVVSIHQHIRVKVLSIDMDRKRIQLTMKGVEQN